MSGAQFFDPIKLRETKVCGCKRVHEYAAIKPRVCDRGHLWFECECGSTLIEPSMQFVIVRKIVEQAKKNAQKGQESFTAVEQAMKDLNIDVEKNLWVEAANRFLVETRGL